ncbi:MAG: TatD family hydrolase [Clostridiaceae bacterium]|jgi:TatD DNase family protein|nr:TatD family hydrolase [Clostridiaceae bacterium]
MLIDVHCHLNDPRLIDDAPSIVADFPKDGLLAVVNAAYDRESAQIGAELAARYDSVYATVGIHPHDAVFAVPEDYEVFAELLKRPKILAVGETGLDYFYDKSPRDIQRRVFREHLELARAAHKPVVLHIRDAYGDALDILKDARHCLEKGVLLHCYGGGAEAVKDFSRFDCFYSFGGAVTFNNGEANRASLAAVPRDRLLLETDCPYMTPVPFRGQLNYPKHVRLVALKVAEVLGISVEEVEELNKQNAEAFFKVRF